MGVKINEDQWQKVESKYTKLIEYSANRIYCDRYLWSIEDSCQEIRVSVIKAIELFLEKEGLAFDIAWEEADIHQYIKATIWHTKSNIGMRIRKASEVGNGVLVAPDSRTSVDESQLTGVQMGENNPQSHSSYEGTKLYSYDSEPSIFNDLNLNEDQRKIINLVLGDLSNFKPNDKINIKKVSSLLGWPVTKTNKTLQSIRHLITIYG